jgi:cysteine desulfurase
MTGQLGIYLDHNASTPVAPEVRKAMLVAMDSAFGNPSSQHWAGAPARTIVEDARGKIAKLLSCAPDEIILTSGGSQANNLALKGTFYPSGRPRAHFITTTVEHPAIVAPLQFVERLGASVTLAARGRTWPNGPRRFTPRDQPRDWS